MEARGPCGIPAIAESRPAHTIRRAMALLESLRSARAYLSVSGRLHVKIGHLQRVPDDKVTPRLHHIAHQRAEHLGGVLGIADLHLQ